MAFLAPFAPLIGGTLLGIGAGAAVAKSQAKKAAKAPSLPAPKPLPKLPAVEDAQKTAKDTQKTARRTRDTRGGRTILTGARGVEPDAVGKKQLFGQ